MNGYKTYSNIVHQAIAEHNKMCESLAGKTLNTMSLNESSYLLEKCPAYYQELVMSRGDRKLMTVDAEKIKINPNMARVYETQRLIDVIKDEVAQQEL